MPEPVQVHRQRVGREQVAAGFAGDPHVVGDGQQLAQPGQVGRQRVASTVRGPVRRDGPVDVDQQGHENAPLPSMAGIEPVPVNPSLDVAE